MAEPRALLFDMDGTLIDTAEAVFTSYAAALAEAGALISRAEFDRHATGRHWRQFLPLILADRGSAADACAVARRKRELYPRHILGTRLNGELVELARCSRPRAKIGLVTSASRESTEAVLDFHAIQDLFDTIVTGDDVERPKPAPDPYLLAAERLGIAPQHCLAFEDSDIGAQSALSAAMVVRRVSF